MILNCPATNFQIGGDILTRVPGKYPIHNFSLPNREIFDLPRRDIAPGRPWPELTQLLQSTFDNELNLVIPYQSGRVGS